MIHPDRCLRDIVSAETGEMVHSIPDGGLCDVFFSLVDAWEGSHLIVACGVFLGVWA